MQLPRSFRILAYLALVCMPLSVITLYYALGWATVLHEDFDKSFMSEIPGFHPPASTRSITGLKALPTFIFFIGSLTVGAFVPLIILFIAGFAQFRRVASFHTPGICLFVFLCLCSAILTFVGLLAFPTGIGLIVLAAFTAISSFLPIVPSYFQRVPRKP